MKIERLSRLPSWPSTLIVSAKVIREFPQFDLNILKKAHMEDAVQCTYCQVMEVDGLFPLLSLANGVWLWHCIIGMVSWNVLTCFNKYIPILLYKVEFFYFYFLLLCVVECYMINSVCYHTISHRSLFVLSSLCIHCVCCEFHLFSLTINALTCGTHGKNLICLLCNFIKV